MVEFHGRLRLQYEGLPIIQTAGMTQSAEKRCGRCHCGAVEFEVTLPNGIEDIRRCNCSLCSRRGAIAASVSLENLEVVSGHEQLALYTWNTDTAKHFFCKVCGIYTHHQRRSNPTQYGFNLACIDGFRLEDYPEVPVVNGRGMSLVEEGADHG